MRVMGVKICKFTVISMTLFLKNSHKFYTSNVACSETGLKFSLDLYKIII